MAGRPTQRGVVFPSPVVVLSIVAVAMAALAFVVTRGGESDERPVATTARADQSPSATPTTGPTAKPKKKKPAVPPVQRAQTYVEVYNNSGITGLAGSVGAQATDAGWRVVGTDNWYGTVSGNTVFFPERLERAAKQLALDLGIDRTAPSVGSMKLDRLTIVLTNAL